MWFFARVVATTDPSWTTYLLNGGPFAIVVLLIITDKLTPPGERDRLRIENETLRKQLDSLNENIRHEIVPLLTQLNILNTQTIEALGKTRKAINSDDNIR
jgi:di/tricarboxylate transporter